MNYLSFYALEREPFSNALNSRFYYNSAQHARAVVRMMFAIENMKGLAVVTGPVGTGKSTTARRLLDSLPKERFEAAILSMVQSGVSPQWLLAKVAYQLGITQPADDRTRLLGQLYRRLYSLNREGKKAVLLIDEAQMLDSPEVMEVLRGLLSLEIPGQKLMTLCLFGLPGLDATLRLDPSLHQRIAVRGRLGPLGADEAEAYIKHRLRLAGASQMLFTREAVEAIFAASGGVPRVTNTLCDNALFEGFLTRTNPITRRLVAVVAEELGVMSPAPAAHHLAPDPSTRPRASRRRQESAQASPLDAQMFRAGGRGPRLSPSSHPDPTPQDAAPPRPRPSLGPGLRRAAAIVDGGLFAEAGLSWPSSGDVSTPEGPESEIALYDEPAPSPAPPPELTPAPSPTSSPPLKAPEPPQLMLPDTLPFSEDLQATQPMGRSVSQDKTAAPTQQLSPSHFAAEVEASPSGEPPPSEARRTPPLPGPGLEEDAPEATASQEQADLPAAGSWIDSFELTPAPPAVSEAPQTTKTLDDLLKGIDLGERSSERAQRISRPLRLESEAAEGPTQPSWRRRQQAPEPEEKPSALRRLFGFASRR